jgi:formate hydrogenlyase subunit 6/NADH:ubiquinone oxidoreductase subunit I/flavodoxin
MSEDGFSISTEIYYFSGTGNSLYVARELQKRIPETNLIPIVSLLNQDVIEIKGETLGFVFPIHYTAIPIPVKMFIKKLDLKSTKYVFAIATRLGTPHRAFIDIEKILKKKGKSLDSRFALNMANNDPKSDYKVPTKKEIKKFEYVVNTRLSIIQKIIINKEKSHEKDTDITFPVSPLVVKLVPIFRPFLEFTRLKSRYYADSKCTGCGTCEKVCLSKKIKMINKKPVWQKNVQCFYCYACINYCPKQSVQIKSFTEKNGRYSHPYATSDDIARQKYLK